MDVDHNIFPSLRYTYLRVFADRMAIEHDYIVKITLHHAPFHSYNENYHPIKYLVCFHVPDPDGKDEYLCASIRVFKNYFEAPGWPDERSGLPVELWRDDSFFVDVYQGHAKGGREEWEFRAISEIPHEWIEEFWVLFDRSDQDSAKEQCVKGITEIRGPSSAIQSPEAHTCGEFVRGLRFFYENDNEVKIQEPGKKPKIYDYDRMGFSSVEADGWKYFVRIIRGPDHYCKYGPSKTGNQKVKAYDAKRSRLTEINKKLVRFFAKEYDLEIPQGFKTFERAIEEGPGVQKFKFQIENRVKKSKYEEYSKEALLDEISGLTKQMYMAFNSDDLSKQSKTNEISDSLAVAVAQAKEKGWISNSDLPDILNDDRIWTPQEERFDPHENSPQTKSLH
jgi:hypothetical protein